MALGYQSATLGQSSITLGANVTSGAFDEVVVGSYNSLPANLNGTSWVATDPIFVVGNGTTASTRSDAVTVLKNGAVLVHPSGDLQMGNYIAGPQP